MTIDASMLENLMDAGCDEGMIERYREIAADNGSCGPALIRLLEKYHPQMNDSAIQFYYEDFSDKGPIFSVK